MTKTTTITSDLICVEKIFSEAKSAHALAVELAGFADVFLFAVKEAVPGLKFKVKDGPQEMVSLYLEITVTEEKK